MYTWELKLSNLVDRRRITNSIEIYHTYLKEQANNYIEKINRYTFREFFPKVNQIDAKVLLLIFFLDTGHSFSTDKDLILYIEENWKQAFFERFIVDDFIYSNHYLFKKVDVDMMDSFLWEKEVEFLGGETKMMTELLPYWKKLEKQANEVFESISKDNFEQSISILQGIDARCRVIIFCLEYPEFVDEIDNKAIETIVEENFKQIHFEMLAFPWKKYEEYSLFFKLV